MIAAYREPKGLSPEAIPLASRQSDVVRMNDAINGSARLRDTILRVKGYTYKIEPPVVIPFPVKPPAFRKRKRLRGRAKGSRKVRHQNARIEQIKALVAVHFGISVESLMRRCKKHRLARPRQIAMYLSRKTTTASFPDIGIQFGGRHHTTVLHAFCEIERRVAAKHPITIAALVAVHAVIGA